MSEKQSELEQTWREIEQRQRRLKELFILLDEAGQTGRPTSVIESDIRQVYAEIIQLDPLIPSGEKERMLDQLSIEEVRKGWLDLGSHEDKDEN